MALQADFDRAAEDVRKLKARPDDGELKELYGLYKQVIVGDINIVLFKEMWHIYTMEHYGAIEKDEFMSFAGTWMKLETIILSKLSQDQKTKHVLTRKWELNNENTWTQGGEHHTLGPVGGWGARGGITLGEIPNVGDWLMGAANRRSMCIPAVTNLHILHMEPRT
ncbi:acyl-CoA-binding domain-containing protein 7 isoform X1 [Pongo abelii]|uniref:acyl-CoA-binding domain-containing protein 7 isoform X1 n=1 Tax=Pongo abelii TaxID=9601 RepID=UPI0023E8E8E3|nr:acyl-CoA-binding domain-containing protein 7 isoform X1 [Pongo abelii]